MVFSQNSVLDGWDGKFYLEIFAGSETRAGGNLHKRRAISSNVVIYPKGKRIVIGAYDYDYGVNWIGNGAYEGYSYHGHVIAVNFWRPGWINTGDYQEGQLILKEEL